VHFVNYHHERRRNFPWGHAELLAPFLNIKSFCQDFIYTRVFTIWKNLENLEFLENFQRNSFFTFKKIRDFYGILSIFKEILFSNFNSISF